MKIRDSGMPSEEYWETLFDVPLILSRLGIRQFHDVAELGCGYGTFSIPVAQAISGTLYAFDVEPEMIVRTRERGANLPIVCELRDVLADGFGVNVDAVLLFNILHCEQPTALLRYAADALRPAGQVLAIHWRYAKTPRGPSLDMRPTPQQIIEWAAAVDLCPIGPPIDLPPWHYGVILGQRSSQPYPVSSQSPAKLHPA
jgi:SAM-dependent methyltransferase